MVRRAKSAAKRGRATSKLAQVEASELKTLLDFVRYAVSRFVMIARLDPAFAVRTIHALPEWRVRLQVIHQEFGGLERGMAMFRCGHDQHDIFTGRDPADAMDDPYS